MKRDSLYKAIAWTFGLSMIALYYYTAHVPSAYDKIFSEIDVAGTSTVAKARANSSFGSSYTWRDRSGNVNMRGTFKPDKPGSRTGRMEIRDGNGNLQSTIQVRK